MLAVRASASAASCVLSGVTLKGEASGMRLMATRRLQAGVHADLDGSEASAVARVSSGR